WRLAPGEGIADWVARHGESVIVPDTREDERHCKSVGQQIGLEIRSLLSIPLKVRQDVIGVLEAVDTEAGRFDATHVTSLEPLAASAAIAIENARMYKQAQQEITERKRAEDALRESERKYRTTLDSMADAIHLVGPDLRITLANQAHQQQAKEFGSDTPDYIGRTIFEVFPSLLGGARDRLCDEYDQVFRTGETLITEESITFGDREFVAEIRKIPIFEKEKVTQVVTVMRDITERKRAEEALRESEEKLRAQYKGIPLPTYTWQRVGQDFVLVDYNDAAVTITQGKIADWVGTRAGEMYQDDPEILEEFSRCFTEKTFIEREMPYRFKSTGESKHLAVKYAFVPPDLVLVHT
ncbi:MAG: PAS domain-containing protein, partial [Anaerolineae bacterium]|nr:PAS domain-containing protein [Anaerolineae bacterium]